MKQLLLILLLFAANSTLLSAQNDTSDIHKKKMMTFINKCKFEKALQEIEQVQDWNYDINSKAGYVDAKAALQFCSYMDSMNYSAPMRDSFHIYIAQEGQEKGLEHYEKGAFTSVIPYWEMTAYVIKIRKGEYSPLYIKWIYSIGIMYETVGDFKKAEDCYTKVLEIRKATSGINHPDYAASLYTLGILYAESMGDYKKAEECYLQALAIQEKVLDKNHPDYIASLDNLGVLYCNKGNYQKAEYYMLQALEIKKETLGTQHYDYVQTLHNIGFLYFCMGNYEKAERYSLQAMEMKKELVGTNHPDYAMTLDNLGILYENMGDFKKAEECYVQALEIQKEAFGINHPEYSNSLNNLGNAYYRMRDYQKAEEIYLSALDIQKNAHKEKNSVYAKILHNLGALYLAIGDSLKAEEYCLQSIKIQSKILDKNHPDYAASLYNLGIFYNDKGEYQKAEDYFLQALEIQKEALGIDHYDCAMTLNRLGNTYYSEQNYRKAKDCFTQVVEIQKNRYVTSLSFLGELQREKYWNFMQGLFLVEYPRFFYLIGQQDPTISVVAYDNELFTHNILLNSSVFINNSILESKDSMLINQWEELKDIKQTIITLQENNDSLKLSACVERAEQIEKELTKSSAAYRENQAMWQITWDSVRNHLSSNQVAIEYMASYLNDDSTMYCALLLRDTSSFPIMIPLFNENEEIIPDPDNFIAEKETNLTYRYDKNGEMLSTLIWGKILPYIKPGETIYFSPTGIFHQLAIEALPYDEEHTMADVFNLVRLSSTREIVTNKDETHYATATLYGGIQYDMNATEILAASERYNTDDLLASRGLDNDTLNRGSVQFLKGSKTEVENINSMLKQNNLQVQLFTSTNANEESFKALSGKHQNILHIATHGFFWTDSTAHEKDYVSQRMILLGNDISTPPTIDPLNRCGLLFAGANTALQGHSAELPEGVQDGVLTAKEISLLDLRDADLVVLSACETGTGEITSEGVFGLQRAFKMAGAQTIIMSLWPVYDMATQLLMTEFYRNWITNHQSKREAFRNAQNTVRSQYEEPVYWAGFIMLD